MYSDKILDIKIILLIILIGIFPVYYNITGTLPDKDNPLPPSADETTFLNCLKNMEPANFNFDTGYYLSGSFIPYMLGVGLKIGESFGIIKIVKSEDFYFKNITEWANFFLVGRIINTLYMFVLVISLYYLFYLMSKSRIIAFFSSIIVFFLPEYAIQSKIITTNVAVATFTILGLFAYLKIYEKDQKIWYILAGIFTGLAFATKYSSLPLPLILMVILVVNYFQKKLIKIKMLLIYIFFLILTFFIFNPYFFIKFSIIIEVLKKYSKIFNMYNSATSIGFTFNFPLKITLRYAMGLPLMIFSILGLIWRLFKGNTKEKIIIMWIILFYLFLAKANDKAFIGRSTVITCLMPYFAIILLKDIRVYLKNIKVVKYVIGLLFLVCIVYTIMFNTAILLSLDKNKQVRYISSDWIERNIPKDSSIGLARLPFWWHSNILYKEYWHKNTPFYGKSKYKMICYDWEISKFKNNMADYFIIGAQELRYKKYGTSTKFPKRKKFIDYFLHSNNYKLIKEFKRNISFIFDFNVPEIEAPTSYATSPLFYQSSIYIYKRIK